MSLIYSFLLYIWLAEVRGGLIHFSTLYSGPYFAALTVLLGGVILLFICSWFNLYILNNG